MREKDVQQRLVEYLESDGWSVVVDDPSFIDVIARKDGETLIAEVKGHMTNPGDNGVSVDILFGQLLRRMSSAPARYAVFVPESLFSVVDRVSAAVRTRLGIEVWLVPEEGEPRLHSEA